MGFRLMNDHIFEVDTTPTAGKSTWARVAYGIKNVSPATNEEVDQTAYLDAQVGFKESDVVGAQLVLAFTADRKYDDEAQNYIFGLLLELGPNRRTKFRQTEPDGGIFEGPVTIANITPPGGDAGAKGECSFEVHFNGKPTYISPALPEIPGETEETEETTKTETTETEEITETTETEEITETTETEEITETTETEEITETTETETTKTES